MKKRTKAKTAVAKKRAAMGRFTSLMSTKTGPYSRLILFVSLFASLVIIFFVGSRLLAVGIVDDAYIIFRYAANFAHGLGLVYNEGERVEGYTTFLWTLMLGLFAKVGWMPDSSARILESFFALSTFAILIRLAPFGNERRWLPAFALVLSPAYVFWCGSGIGVSLFCLLLTASVLSFVLEMKRMDEGASSGIISGLLLSLAALTRMEALLLLPLNVFFAFNRLRDRRVTLTRFLLGHLGCVLIPFLTFFCWRWHYYGWPMPNTYYCKMWIGGFDLWLRGLGYVGEFTLATAFLPLVAVASLLFSRDWRERYLAGIVLFWMVGVVREGGDHFALYRFLVPTLPFLALLLPLWAVRLFSVTPIFVVYLILLVCTSLLTFNNYTSARLIVDATNGWAKTGKWLSRNTQPGDSIATQAIGGIGYYSNRYVADILGLVDEHIAHLPIKVGKGFPGHEKHDAAYTLSKKPTFIVLGPSGMIRYQRDKASVLELVFRGGSFLKGEQDIFMSPDFDALYEFRSISLGDGTYMECFAIKSSAAIVQ